MISKDYLTIKLTKAYFLITKKELVEQNTEIAKDISAFANTLGGTIIYGIEKKDGKPVSFNWINT